MDQGLERPKLAELSISLKQALLRSDIGTLFRERSLEQATGSMVEYQFHFQRLALGTVLEVDHTPFSVENLYISVGADLEIITFFLEW